MTRRTLISRTVGASAGLAVAGIGMAVSARSLATAFEQSVLVAVGSAMFGAALTFLLVRVFSLTERESNT
jgi:hypothetical protein